MKQSNGLQPREASNPTIWPQTGVAAIEFRCARPPMKRNITPNQPGIRGMSVSTLESRECRIDCFCPGETQQVAASQGSMG